MPRRPQTSLVQTVESFLDPATCLTLRRAMDAGEREAAEVLSGGIRLEEHVRRASNVDVDPAALAIIERRLDAWRPRAARLFSAALHSREGASFLRYEPGGFYRPHRDHGHVPSWPGAALRRISVVVFLNSSGEVDPSGAFWGGMLRLHDEQDPSQWLDIRPTAGTLVAFSATRLHEVTRVERGTRDAVADWYY